MYLLGSIEISAKEIKIFHVIDCIGNFIAVIYLVIKICNNKAIKSFDEILHIWSVIVIFGFLSYPENNSYDKIFIQILVILRTLRLLFPLFIKNKFFNVFTKPIKIFNISKKTIFTSILLMILYGLVGY